MSNPIKALDMIRLSDGAVGTLASFLDSGRVEMAPEPVKFHSKRCVGGWRWAHFAEEVGTEDEDGDRNCWEVGKTLWQSRSGVTVDIR